jgi:hypothetical protein
MVTVTLQVPTETSDSFSSVLGKFSIMDAANIILSPEFTLKDFAFCSDKEFYRDNWEYALHMGDAVLLPLKKTAKRAEEIQKILGHKITIQKGIVSPYTNKKLLNSSPASTHMLGEALDFSCPEFGTIYQVCRSLETAYFPFDQLYSVKDHVHVSFRKERMIMKTYAGQGISFLPGILNI